MVVDRLQPSLMFSTLAILNWLIWKKPWCWGRMKAGGEGDDRGWDGWMASSTQWAWVWVNSGSWWWTGRPGVLQTMGSQRVRYNWTTELNWHLLYSSMEDPLKEGMTTPSSILPGESHGKRSPTGYSPWCRKELDLPEATEDAHTAWRIQGHTDRWEWAKIKGAEAAAQPSSSSSHLGSPPE